jgi:hypothetical protein
LGGLQFHFPRKPALFSFIIFSLFAAHTDDKKYFPSFISDFSFILQLLGFLAPCEHRILIKKPCAFLHPSANYYFYLSLFAAAVRRSSLFINGKGRAR